MPDRHVHIILNADDLGMSAATNAAIAHCLAERQIASATIMANGPAFDEAVTIARSHPEASFGVHLNLTEFTPLSGADLTALAPTGSFENVVRGLTLTRSTLAAIGTELESQIERVTAAGVPVTHLDSHHHVHTIPELFPLTLRLAKRHRIRWIRQSRNIYRAGESVPASLRLKKNLWNSALSLSGRRRTDYFGSLLDLTNAATSIPAGSCVEIMLHPGGRGGYVDETSLLATRWWKACGIAPRFESYATAA